MGECILRMFSSKKYGTPHFTNTNERNVDIFRQPLKSRYKLLMFFFNCVSGKYKRGHSNGFHLCI